MAYLVKESVTPPTTSCHTARSSAVNSMPTYRNYFRDSHVIVSSLALNYGKCVCIEAISKLFYIKYNNNLSPTVLPALVQVQKQFGVTPRGEASKKISLYYSLYYHLFQRKTRQNPSSCLRFRIFRNKQTDKHFYHIYTLSYAFIEKLII